MFNYTNKRIFLIGLLSNLPSERVIYHTSYLKDNENFYSVNFYSFRFVNYFWFTFRVTVLLLQLNYLTPSP